MRSTISKVVTATAVLVATAFHLPAGIAAEPYKIIDVGALGNCDSTAHGLNNLGQVVGESSDASFRIFAFATGPGGLGIRNLGTLPGSANSQPASVARAINDAGQVVGTAGNGNGGFITEPRVGTMRRLNPPELGGVYAWNLNQTGQVVGQYLVRGAYHAFLTAENGGALKDLGAFPSDFDNYETYARGVNASGQVVGGATGFCERVPGAFLACGSFTTAAGGAQLRSLGVLGADAPFTGGNRRSYALAVNDRGQIAGYSDTENFGQIHAYISDGNLLDDLGTLGGVSSQANGINNAGQVVGQYTLAGGGKRGFLWTSTGGMTDLNTKIDPASGWTITDAVAINDKGQIAANGTHPAIGNGVCQRALLLGCKDTDEDGLCDDWENEGILDAKGNMLVDLPRMGADPNHKDLFVHVDYMDAPAADRPRVKGVPVADYRMTPAMQRRIVDAFTRAGIRIHIDCGPDCIMDPVKGLKWGENGPTTVSRSQRTDFEPELTSERGAFPKAGFDPIKTRFFPAERLSAFHYALIGHRLRQTGECGDVSYRGGIAYMPGSDLFVALGAHPTIGVANFDQIPQYESAVAGTFMHELGHNLGLDHGGPRKFAGADETIATNLKPNHLSVMNYAYQTTGLPLQSATTQEVFVLDFSRFGTLPLDETTGLFETRGVVGPAGMASYKVRHWCQNAARESRLSEGGANGAINWDCSVIPLLTAGIDPQPVRTNVNDDYEIPCGGAADLTKPVMQRLTSYDEWQALVFGAGAIGAAPGAMIRYSSAVPSEPDVLALEKIRKEAWRVAGGDLDNNGRVNLDDLTIVQRALNTRPKAGDRRDINRDGRIDAVDARLLTTLCDKPRCAR